MSKINLANWIDCTEVEGPGKRFALWTQGCERHCPDCCNPQFFDFIPKTIINSTEVCKLIEKSLNENKIEGITFLGGEPVLQAKGLSEIAKFCKENNLSVMLFTGYTLENLLAENLPFVNELLQWTDLLVDGHFDPNNKETTRNWVGSTNQHFHFLTDRYTSGIEYDELFSHGFELRIHSDGTFQSNGFPLNSL
ncbi:MAG: radical SAM protein [Planctomycetaceae bacterium]|nr:radical SAM protein [Planctomycetaceae bacterium]